MYTPSLWSTLTFELGPPRSSYKAIPFDLAGWDREVQLAGSRPLSIQLRAFRLRPSRSFKGEWRAMGWLENHLHRCQDLDLSIPLHDDKPANVFFGRFESHTSTTSSLVVARVL